MKKIQIVLILFCSFQLMAQQNDWLTIGIVRIDGIVVPTQRYENNKWKNITNRYQQYANYESELKQWFYCPYDGDPYSISSDSLIHYDSDLAEGFGYQTNLANKEKQYRASHVRKTGFALSKKQSIEKFQNYDSITIHYKEILKLISKQKIKITKWNKDLYDWDKHFGKDHISDFKEIILKGVKLKDSFLFYFEAINHFSNIRNTGCPGILFTNGWVVFKKDKYEVIEKFIAVDNCDAKQLSNKLIKPQFILELDNKIFMYNIRLDWDGEVSEIMEITKHFMQ